jgi:long-chain acyl-CoA synthetase
MLTNAATYQSDKVATWFYGAEMTFWELYIKSIRMANALIEIGVKKGDRVGLMLPNSPQFIIAYWATLIVGAIVVNLNPIYTFDETLMMAKKTGLTTIFTFDMLIPLFKPLSQTIELPRVIVTKLSDFMLNTPVSTPEELGLEGNWYHFSKLIDDCNNEICPRVAIDPEVDPAIIQFTGGTTGIPKGAVLTHKNVVAATYATVYWSKGLMAEYPVERRCVIGVLPYFHVYGEICALNYSSVARTTQILLPRFEVEEFLQIIDKFKEISYFPAVPTMLTALMSYPGIEKYQLGKKIKYICSGGAPCPGDLIEKLLDANLSFTEGWGMSETTAVGLSLPSEGRKKPGAAGIPYIDVELRIVDPETGLDVPLGERGEILVKAPYVMKEYWNEPEETANQLKDGWLSTGDVAYMDEEGYVFIVDRTKDLIIAGGYNIYPRDVDEVLFQHPKVADVITVGIPDEYRGETVKAFIQLKPGQTATDEEIIAFCRERLAAYKVPKLIEFRDGLPRSMVGKALRRQLRDEEIAKKKD